MFAQRQEMTRLSILLRLTRKGYFMSIFKCKVYALLSKNAFHDSTSAAALFLICPQISGSSFYKIVLIKREFTVYATLSFFNRLSSDIFQLYAHNFIHFPSMRMSKTYKLKRCFLRNSYGRFDTKFIKKAEKVLNS